MSRNLSIFTSKLCLNPEPRRNITEFEDIFVDVALAEVGGYIPFQLPPFVTPGLKYIFQVWMSRKYRYLAVRK